MPWRMLALVVFAFACSLRAAPTRETTLLSPSAPSIESSEQQKVEEAVALYREFLTALTRHYHTDVDAYLLTRRALQRITAALDPHIRLADNDGFFECNTDLGTGVVLGQFGDRTLVKRFASESAGLAAGLKLWDAVAAVDGIATLGMTFDEIVWRIVCGKRRAVRLTVLRREAFHAIIVPKKEHAFRDFFLEELVDNVGYIYMANFDWGASIKMAEALGHLRRNNATAIILDIRSMDGGSLWSMATTLGHFLPAGAPYALADNTVLMVKASFPAIPNRMVVLTNRGTASAGEVMAGALQANGRAVVIGERTAGFGSRISDFPLSGNMTLWIPTGKYLTPTGMALDGKGVVPDIPVQEENPFAQYVRGAYDPILERALAYLRCEDPPKTQHAQASH